MRRFSISGALAVALLAGSGLMAGRSAIIEAQTEPSRPVSAKPQRKRAAPTYRYWQRRFPKPTRIQRHTGSGGAGAHRAWKKRRAAGRE